MSLKAVGMYGGFFIGMFVLALFVTGTFRDGLLPRFAGRGASAAGDRQPSPTKADPATALERRVSEAPPTPAPTQLESVAAAPGKAPSAEAETGAHVKRLARMYEGMRPKEAAAVLEKLDRPLAALVLMEIRERQASKILGAMSPAAAADLTRMVGQTSEKTS